MAEREKVLKQIEKNFKEYNERHTEKMDESTCRKRPARDSETEEPDTIPDTYEQNKTDNASDEHNRTTKKAKVLKSGRIDDTQTLILNPNPEIS